MPIDPCVLALGVRGGTTREVGHSGNVTERGLISITEKGIFPTNLDP